MIHGVASTLFNLILMDNMIHHMQIHMVTSTAVFHFYNDCTSSPSWFSSGVDVMVCCRGVCY